MNTLKTFLLIIALCVIAIGATANNSSPTWEYKFEYKVNEKRANQLAADGWELAAVGNEAGGTMSAIPFMVFKRQK